MLAGIVNLFGGKAKRLDNSSTLGVLQSVSSIGLDSEEMNELPTANGEAIVIPT